MDADAGRRAPALDERAADGDCDEHRDGATLLDLARERAHRRRAEDAPRAFGRGRVSEAAPLLFVFEPGGQRRALLDGVEADAARRLVHARELRRFRAETPRLTLFAAAPHVDARARKRRPEQRRTLFEPALRGAFVRARRELEQRGGHRARVLERLALGRADLDREDAHHRLRRAARRGERAQEHEQHDGRQADEQVRDDQAAADAPQQQPLEADENLQAVVNDRRADGEERQHADEADRRVPIKPGVTDEQSQDVERDRRDRHARHQSPQPLARARQRLRGTVERVMQSAAHHSHFPSDSTSRAGIHPFYARPARCVSGSLSLRRARGRARGRLRPKSRGRSRLRGRRRGDRRTRRAPRLWPRASWR